MPIIRTISLKTLTSLLRFLRSAKLPVLMFLVTLTSCFVNSPKFTTIDQVMKLQLGMTQNQVENILQLKPYDFKANTETGNTYIYIYRVFERRTLSFNTKSNNGNEQKGKYVQLEVTYSKQDSVTKIESCNLCPDNLVTNSKIDLGAAFVFLTVTLPVILLYLK